MSVPVSDYAMVFTTGLVGSAHCVGMCGGFVLMYSVEVGAGGRPSPSAHAAFNLGRIFTYSVVGGVMGLVGSFVETAGAIKGVQGLALLLAGGLMILMALNLIGVLGRPGLIDSAGLSGSGPFRSAFLKIMSLKGPLATLALGLLLGFIPCGLSYTMEIKAASSGGFWQGASLMAVFGLGTAPAMFGLGFVSSALAAKLRERIYKVAAVLVLLMGVQAVLRGMAASGWIEHGPAW